MCCSLYFFKNFSIFAHFSLITFKIFAILIYLLNDMNRAQLSQLLLLFSMWKFVNLDQ